MGCKLSCRPKSTFQGVRVVHINGYVEEYPVPVTVSEVTGKPPHLVCFSPAQLLSFAPRPLPLDDTLESGKLYFLLPYTVFRSDTSPVDLATLVTRLTALSRNGAGGAAASKPKLIAGGGQVLMGSPQQHGETRSAGEAEGGGGGGGIVGRMPSRAWSWKPMLDTIEESSVGRSTQSLSSSCRQPPRG